MVNIFEIGMLSFLTIGIIALVVMASFTVGIVAGGVIGGKKISRSIKLKRSGKEKENTPDAPEIIDANNKLEIKNEQASNELSETIDKTDAEIREQERLDNLVQKLEEDIESEINEESTQGVTNQEIVNPASQVKIDEDLNSLGL